MSNLGGEYSWHNLQFIVFNKKNVLLALIGKEEEQLSLGPINPAILKRKPAIIVVWHKMEGKYQRTIVAPNLVNGKNLCLTKEKSNVYSICNNNGRRKNFK